MKVGTMAGGTRPTSLDKSRSCVSGATMPGKLASIVISVMGVESKCEGDLRIYANWPMFWGGLAGASLWRL
jgi:hypothetical protein